MSALPNVVPIDSKAAKPRCAECIRDTDDEVASPCKTHRRKYDGHSVAALSEEQVTAFLAAAQSDVRANAMFRLMFCHGLRVSELARLRLSDVNFKEKTIRVCPLKKKKATSYLEPLLPGEAEALLAYLKIRPEAADTDPFFISRKSKTVVQPMHRSYILKLYVEIAKRAGLPARLWHPHAFRHSTAMAMYRAMLEAGHVDMPSIQLALRHDSVASTSVYVEPTVESVAISKTNLFGSLLVAR
jgi:type 1 fimbriae regulatory protein FimB